VKEERRGDKGAKFVQWLKDLNEKSCHEEYDKETCLPAATK
jgi:hypothetical protein